MTQLPTDRTITDTVAEHLSDHNILCAQHNELDGHAAATTDVHGIADTADLATQADVTAAIDALVDAAPGTLDTLNELAAALGDDANFASTVTTALAGKEAAGTAASAVATHEADTTSVHGIANTANLVLTSDSRLSDARTPTGHHTSHEPGGSDALAADAAAATASLRTLGTGAAQACAGNDSRLSDTRTPTDGSVTDAKVAGAAAIAESKLSLASDAAAGTASRRTLGTGATQAAAGNHAHSGTYVPLATIDAAGDLLVGDADNSVTRLAKGTALQVLRVNAGATALEYADPSGGGVPGEYGDGSDGVVNFDGTTTVLGLVPSSGVYTLTRDVYLASGSQVSGSAIIKCANFRIFCRGTFTIGASATIHNDGNAASGATGGAATAAGTIIANKAGGNGSAGGAGAAGSAPTAPLGGASGASGAASGGPGVGGGGASVAATLTAGTGSPRSLVHVFLGPSGVLWGGGPSAAAGTAVASSTGGGGGAGGSILALFVYDLVVAGVIRAAGGAGGAASGAGTGAGGGGGGGGGAVIVVYHTKSGAGSTFTAATNAPGGSGGAPQGAGKTGAAGSNGAIYEIVH